MSPWSRVGAAVLAVGWGANQFSPLLIVYRDQEHLSPTVVTAIFGAYVVGLIPALLLGARFSDRFGRRRIMRPVLVLSAVASLILLLGAGSIWLLALGRLVAGVASGAAFGPGSAWIKELSTDAGPGAGARRAAISLSAGFGSGPLVAGALAQWLPAPAVVPYVVHIVVTVVVGVLAWHVPETVTGAGKPGARQRALKHALTSREFLRRIVPSAPLVFAVATTSFAVLPALLPVPVAPVASSGAIAGLTLGSGLLVQPVARALERRRSPFVLSCGLALTVLGFLLAALSTALGQALLTLPAAVVLGAAYGMLLVGGLSRVEALAEPSDLAGVTAVFYCLAYLGFAAPYLFAAVDVVVPAPAAFVVAAAVAAVLIAVTAPVRRLSGRIS
ncbi:MFS transporter [Amycolatopsis sp. FDAARGOS 1241]|uniref:MFS transporter n=1 Tax=Amycolatopsis sp. FDAARGOS 1241 TaxID=2778070 RepID=UPI00194DC1EA|nr:MFS transporter [Amycolatopsis sp. FDAARGOS 1241]QRP47779.1 MFS transporter [Amycolatopsis sp. FDAARGOS 1241]